MGSTRRAVSVAVAVATATAVLALPTAAQARFADSNSAALSVSSDTLAPPTNPSLSAKCRGSSGNSTVSVAWTPSVDAYAGGYVVTLTATGAPTSTTSVPGGSTSSATVSVPRSGTPYTVTVQTTYQQWTSVAATAPGTVSC